MAATDWDKIKAEYIAGGTSYRELAEKHDISEDKIKKRAAKEKWRDLRNDTCTKIARKVQEKIVQRKADAVVDELAVARYTAQIWQDTLQQVAALLGSEERMGILVNSPGKAVAMSEAIRTNIDSLMKTCKLLSAAEAKKLELEERRLKLEEKKFEAEQKAKDEGEGKGIEVVLHLPEGVSVG